MKKCFQGLSDDMKVYFDNSDYYINAFNIFIEEIIEKFSSSRIILLQPFLSRHKTISSFFYTYSYFKATLENDIHIDRKTFPTFCFYIFSQNTKLNPLYISYIKLLWMYYLFKLHVSAVYNISKILLKLFLARNKNNRKSITLKEIIIIETFLTNDSITSTGEYQDRYYPGLHDSIKSRDDVYFLPHPRLTRKVRTMLCQLSRNKVNYIYMFDFLKFIDLIYVLMYPFKISSKSIRRISPQNIQLQLLVKEELQSSFWNPSTIFGLLNYRFMKRLNENRVRIKLYIDWYENQIIDKGIILGLKKFYPTSYIKGYQGFLVNYNYNFHLIPSKEEVKAKITPDEICVIGKTVVKNFESISDIIKITTAPAFRFNYLFKNNIIKPYSKYILISLPIYVSEVKYIITLFYQYYKLYNPIHLNFIIKNHPLHPLKENFEISFLAKQKNISFSKVNFRQLIKEVGISICSLNSSTGIESLANMVPVIFIYPKNQMRTKPKISFDLPSDVFCFVNNEYNLSNKINKFLNYTESSNNKLLDASNFVLDSYYTIPSDIAIDAFLSPHKI